MTPAALHFRRKWPPPRCHWEVSSYRLLRSAWKWMHCRWVWIVFLVQFSWQSYHFRLVQRALAQFQAKIAVSVHCSDSIQVFKSQMVRIICFKWRWSGIFYLSHVMNHLNFYSGPRNTIKVINWFRIPWSLTEVVIKRGIFHHHQINVDRVSLTDGAQPHFWLYLCFLCLPCAKFIIHYVMSRRWYS